MTTAGTVVTTFTGQNCFSSNGAMLSMAVDASTLLFSLEPQTVVTFDRATGTCTATANGDLPNTDVGDVALHNGIAYVATDDEGVLRYDIANGTWLAPWISTGVNGVNFAPVATIGNELFLGLPGFGVVCKDLFIGELLTPVTASRQGTQLPSNQIYALESDGSNLYIGTQQGARRWDGSQFSTFG